MPRRRLIPILAVAATAALASTQLAGASTKDMTFTDKASDNGSALDVTQVAVANDAAGNVTMRIPFPSAASLPSDASILIVMDTDQNPNTGDPGGVGAEYFIDVEGSNNSYSVGQWNGSAYVAGPSSGVVVGYSAGLVVGFPKGTFAIGNGFNFWVRTIQGGDESPGHFD